MVAVFVETDDENERSVAVAPETDGVTGEVVVEGAVFATAVVTFEIAVATGN